MQCFVFVSAREFLEISCFFLFSSTGVQFVIGVTGKSIEMPCHMTTEDVNDRPILALWYKQGRRLPIYRYDRTFNCLHSLRVCSVEFRL